MSCGVNSSKVSYKGCCHLLPLTGHQARIQDRLQGGTILRWGPSLAVLQEQEAFAAAASLDTHKALVHIFFAQRATKKVTGVTDAGLTPRKVRKVAVLGGGLMGSGIATAGLLAGQEVIIKEVNEKFMEVCFSASSSCRSIKSQTGRPCVALYQVGHHKQS